MIQLHTIAFSYGAHPVLHDVSATLSNGHMIGVLGANGAGKSTLLKLIAGFLHPTQGTIAIHGRPLTQWSQRDLARQLAYIPQDLQLPFPFRVFELVLMGRIPHLPGFGFGSSHDHAIVTQALHAVDAWQFESRRFTELSGGERQRVLLARALAQEPRVLILDEPTAFLDIQHQVLIMRFLQRWRQETGGTVIAALHDLNLAAQFCQSVLLLKQGQILAQGPTDTTLTYANVCSTFDTEVYVGLNELNGRPYFVPM